MGGNGSEDHAAPSAIEARAIDGGGNDDGKPQMLVFGTGERIASTDRVFSGEAGALLLKWKREADAAVAKAAREMERLKAEADARLAALELDHWRESGGGLQ